MNYKHLMAALLCMLFSTYGFSQDSGPGDTNIAWGTYYTIKPDYRRCAYPFCGGWWLTKVNDYSVTVDATLLDGVWAPQQNPIYVVNIDYRALGLSKDQIAKFEQNIYAGRAFIRGVLRPYIWTSSSYVSPLQSLAATGTWLAANDNSAIGPFLNVKSTGIVCITTPCPYYEANILNTYFNTQVHELNLKRANLTAKQTEQAWRDLAQGGLIMTGVRFVSQGQTGPGLGMAATKVFFSFPD